MFTGIIAAIGTVRRIEDKGLDSSMVIGAGKLDMSDVCIGGSICVNGVCLTVTRLKNDNFQADVSNETLSCTTLGLFSEGDRVNLEKAMRAGDRFDGHLVSGHVDGVGVVVKLQEDARSVRYDIEIHPTLSRYVCKKGSICVDGVSLTVNSVADTSFSVNIIPHTMDETVFSTYREGTRVNVEVDIIARYLERLHSKVL